MEAATDRSEERLLRQNLEDLKLMHAATESLHDALRRQDTRSANMLIAERGRLMARIEARQRRPGRDGSRPAPTPVREELVAALRETMARIASLNEACLAVAAAGCDELRTAIAAAAHGRDAVRGYAGRRSRPQRFVDCAT
jgi:hypothetical protein